MRDLLEDCLRFVPDDPRFVLNEGGGTVRFPDGRDVPLAAMPAFWALMNAMHCLELVGEIDPSKAVLMDVLKNSVVETIISVLEEKMESPPHAAGLAATGQKLPV